MPTKNNRSCKVCGDQYYYCPSCVPLDAPDRYKMVFCSLNCKDIFDVVSNYAFKKTDKLTAKSILSELDLSKRNQFSEKISEDIDEIMKSPKKAKKKFAVIDDIPAQEEQVVAAEESVFIPIEDIFSAPTYTED